MSIVTGSERGIINVKLKSNECTGIDRILSRYYCACYATQLPGHFQYFQFIAYVATLLQPSSSVV